MRLNRATRVTMMVVLVVIVALVSTAVALQATYEMRARMRVMWKDNLPSVRAAQRLQGALLEQRGLVSSYILAGGEPSFLEELRRRESGWSRWLVEARRHARTPTERAILRDIVRVYRVYGVQRSRAVALFDAGNTIEARDVLIERVMPLSELARLGCERLMVANENAMLATIEAGNVRARNAAYAATVSVALLLIAAVTLLTLLFREMVQLRRLAEATRAFGKPVAVTGGGTTDELHAVTTHVRTMMTELTETRDILARSRDRWELSEKLAALGKLAATVAHEIRNPLSSIRLWVYAIRSSVAGQPEIIRQCDLLDGEVQRLERIVRNVLDFSRAPDLQLRPEHVPNLVEQTLELLSRRMTEARIEAELRNSHDARPVLADAEQLKQALLDLLANAIEAMPDGGRVVVSTELESRNGDGSWVVVRIADTGPGVAESVRERLFVPFLTTKEDGTGLGLSIAAGIVERHGGQLDLEASSSEGATFVMRLPAMAA